MSFLARRHCGRLFDITRRAKSVATGSPCLSTSTHQSSWAANIAAAPLDTVPPGLPVLRPAHNLAVPTVRATTLPNGFRVVTQESFGQVTTFALFVDAGSMYEEGPDELGVCHFLEATAFTSTGNKSAADVQAFAQATGITSQAVFNREVVMLKVRECCSHSHLVYTLVHFPSG